MQRAEEEIAGTERSRQIKRVMWIVLALNLAIALSKILVGTFFGAASVRADGVHSIFDAASNIVALIGISIAARPADESHPYGHGKYAAFASLFIGILLLAAAYEVGWGAIEKLMSGEFTSEASPVSFAVMIVTILINIIVTRYEHAQAVKLKSTVLSADSKHTLSDALVSGSVIIGLIFVSVGFPVADLIATLAVTVAIFITALSVFKDVNNSLSDEMRIDPELIARCVLEIDGVRACHKIRTRGLEGEVHADLHILVDPDMTISRAHAIADEAEVHIQKRFPEVHDVLVHLEPDEEGERDAAPGAVANISTEDGVEYRHIT
jgi:cation diffusion facilitator family transporter